jgi:hypothetical protein
MLTRFTLFIPLLCAAVSGAMGQESNYGVSVPVTVTGNLLYTNAKQTDDYRLSTGSAAGFRAVASPTVNMGEHWFAYSALHLYSSSYYTGSAYRNERAIGFDLMQAFLGYATKIGQTSVLFKAGRLSSAFGLGPIEYDDAKMPLLAPPRVYTSLINLRPDQLPCGTSDLLWQRAGGDIDFHCGGSDEEGYGLAPVTLYGLPGFETEISSHRMDVRLQVTNSSPANPQGLTSRSQSPQLTVGAGYTLPGGLHVGISEFRGAYLDRSVASTLPTGRTIRDYRASGLGADFQWSHGGWSTEGEWQRFHFALPGFAVSPNIYAGYAQAKRILSPRVFVAARVGFERFGRVVDRDNRETPHFQPAQNNYEIAAGYRVNRRQLIKGGFAFGDTGLPSDGRWASSRLANKVEVQLVTELSAVSRAFR